jgi:hypothetical protein
MVMALAMVAGCGSQEQSGADAAVDRAMSAQDLAGADLSSSSMSDAAMEMQDLSVPDLAAAPDLAGGPCANCNMQNFFCCKNNCVDLLDDINNCGACDTKCPGPHPFCNGGVCGLPPCNGMTCIDPQFCCGDQCCGAGQLCCDVPGPIAMGPKCTAPMNGSCPPGCTDCKCNPVGTRIATPTGERRIETLVAGDRVYSVDHGRLVVVPIREVHRQPAHDHVMVRVLFAGGELRESPRHPTADGRNFADLRAGDLLDGRTILSATIVPYEGDATYDLLPDSDSAAYFADGVLIGSTMAPGAAAVTNSPSPSCTF